MPNHSDKNRLLISNTGVACKAFISWLANNEPMKIKVNKSKTMLVITFPDNNEPELYASAREFIANFVKDILI